MTHGVHRVVDLVTVECPIAGRVGHELDVARATRVYVDRGFRSLGCSWNLPSVRAGDLKIITVDVDRM